MHPLKVILLEWVKGSDKVKVQTSSQPCYGTSTALTAGRRAVGRENGREAVYVKVEASGHAPSARRPSESRRVGGGAEEKKEAPSVGELVVVELTKLTIRAVESRRDDVIGDVPRGDDGEGEGTAAVVVSGVEDNVSSSLADSDSFVMAESTC